MSPAEGPTADGGAAKRPAPVSAQTQEDLDKLLGTGLGIGQEQLEAQGTFLPLGLVIGLDGELRMVTVAASPGQADGQSVDADPGMTANEHELDLEAMVEDLYDLLVQQRDELRAAAIISDVHLPESGGDAIHVAAEHSSGLAVSILLPYGHDGGPDGAEPDWQYGELIGEPGECQIWTA